MNVKIMIVEDDEVLSNEISNFLIKWGFETYRVRDFKNITEQFTTQSPHLILMDINLPYFDGFYWCREIRKSSNIPIIYISSRNDDKDKIMGIAQGGDDYVEKPFHLDLLKAKIEAILRRTYEYKLTNHIYLNQDIYFDSGGASLYYKDKCLELTKSERKIINVLIENRPNVVSRDDLMMELWNTDEYVSDTTLSVLVSRLRTKIKDICNENIIETKKGQGYFII